MSFLVRLETSGNQAYIYATNRQRQNVGASELVLRSCGDWVLEAVSEVAGRPSLWAASTEERRDNLLNPAKNAPVSSTNPVEVMVATSGRAELLVDSCATGHRIVKEVTGRALREAPGLGVTGVVLNVDGSRLDKAVEAAGRELTRVRSRLPAPEARFPRLPLIRDCRTTGLPAAAHRRPFEKEEPEDLSAVADAKLEAAEDMATRLAGETLICHRDRLSRSYEHFEFAELSWLGVVHADGNGMGRLFRRLPESIEPGDGFDRRYIERLRRLSLDLEVLALRAVDDALRRAVTRSRKRDQPPHWPLVVPLVLGGDDLTVVCNGDIALRFAREYLDAFERQSIAEIEAEVLDLTDAGRLTGTAGVALVKAHYPFYAAYDLADELVRDAKRHRQRGSMLDFHVLRDSSGSELAPIRSRRWSLDNEVKLWAGPYALGQGDFAHLLEVAERLHRRELLSATAAHSLRFALSRSETEADAELARIRARLKPEDPGSTNLVREHLGAVTKPSGEWSLVESWHDLSGEKRSLSRFLDAMDLSEFWDFDEPT